MLAMQAQAPASTGVHHHAQLGFLCSLLFVYAKDDCGGVCMYVHVRACMCKFEVCV